MGVCAGIDGQRQRVANACVFCGADDTRLTDEHVWGNWLTSAVSHPPTQAYSERVTVSGEQQRWKQPVFAQKVKIACARCNNGWMSQIEEQAKPLVAPMANGTTTRLKPRHQARLATWAALKALVAEHQSRASERFIPAAHYREFYGTKRPLETMRIWLGGLSRPIPARVRTTDWYFTSSSTSDLRGNITAAAPPDLRRDIAEGRSVYSVVMNVGPLLMVVLAHETRGVEGYVQEEAEPCFQQIWPVTGVFRWPPKAVEALGGNTELHKHFGFMGYGPPPEAATEMLQ
jgi:hypothetical protein